MGEPDNYLLIKKDKSTLIINRANYADAPCSGFGKYEGKRPPKCGCKPCLDKFFEVQQLKGHMLYFIGLDLASGTDRSVASV